MNKKDNKKSSVTCSRLRGSTFDRGSSLVVNTKLHAADRFERKQMLVKPIFSEVNSPSYHVFERPSREVYERSLSDIG